LLSWKCKRKNVKVYGPNSLLKDFLREEECL
jgi:hypothetical protein